MMSPGFALPSPALLILTVGGSPIPRFAVSGRAGQDSREDGLCHAGASVLALAVQHIAA